MINVRGGASREEIEHATVIATKITIARQMRKLAASLGPSSDGGYALAIFADELDPPRFNDRQEGKPN